MLAVKECDANKLFTLCLKVFGSEDVSLFFVVIVLPQKVEQ